MDNLLVSRQNQCSLLESKESRKTGKALLQAQNEVCEEEERLLMVLESPINWSWQILFFRTKKPFLSNNNKYRVLCGRCV
ncbi:hypothetical protein TNIN_459411 [Trichonephila inaurata madagascariensis]|uniref:Uncharacterized protein n=1 Tax=Trichonephila inaurata madagascariensis TaxID=2747483 RepID=A0A8X6X1Q1_9ARAC|nr:hypothetical protein TNIN_459411 [Trichonephila inaurata madagascariensis]